MLPLLRTRALKLDCAMVHSVGTHIACARACKPEVDGSAPIPLYVVSECYVSWCVTCIRQPFGHIPNSTVQLCLGRCVQAT